MHADRHTSRGVYTMFWTLTIYAVLGSESSSAFGVLFAQGTLFVIWND